MTEIELIPSRLQEKQAYVPRHGLTMLEVIFSMVVILIGLVAVGLLIPLAGRQAADSYQITQGLAAGESAVRMMEDNKGFQPSEEKPWCVVDNGNVLEMTSLGGYYGEVALTLNGNNLFANTPAIAAFVQNTAIGDGFCIDPLFWGVQPTAYSPPVNPTNLSGLLNREVFPFWVSSIEPTTFTPISDNVPRLRRVTFLNKNATSGITWVRQATATRVATVYGGDTVQADAINKALPPTRGFYVSDTGSLVTSPSASQNPTWMMTLTPSDTTPVISTDLVTGSSGAWSVRPVFIPKIFDAAMVIFAKRDAGEITTSSFFLDWQSNLPKSERAMTVTNISPEAVNSGTFEIDLTGPSTMDSQIKIGSWLMMSRMSYRDLVPSTGNRFQRQVHRWYRVVAVDRESPFPIRVKVVGKPWGPTEGEINDFRNNGSGIRLFPVSNAVPDFPNRIDVHAVVLKDVVQVFERQIHVD